MSTAGFNSLDLIEKHLRRDTAVSHELIESDNIVNIGANRLIPKIIPLMTVTLLKDSKDL